MATEYRLTPFEHQVQHDQDGTVVMFRDDVESRENAVYQAWLAVPNVPDPYVDLSLLSVTVSARQFWSQLALLGKIDETAALNAMAHDIPDVIETFILTLPVGQRFDARMRFKDKTFRRDDAVAITHSKTVFALNDATMDQFFHDAALL